MVGILTWERVRSTLPGIIYFIQYDASRISCFPAKLSPASLSVRLLIIELIIIDERIVRCKFPAFPAFFSLVVLLYFLV